MAVEAVARCAFFRPHTGRIQLPHAQQRLSDECFLSEPIRPLTETVDTFALASGAPGLPSAFVWRDRIVRVAEVLETWKDTGPCRSGSDERYVRKHWFRIRDEAGHEMRIYFERQARSSRERTQRWWLYSICRAALTALAAAKPLGAAAESDAAS